MRRTSLAVSRNVPNEAKERGIDPQTVKVSFGKLAEDQAMWLDGRNPDDPTKVLPPPAGLELGDLDAAVRLAPGRRCSSPTRTQQAVRLAGRVG